MNNAADQSNRLMRDTWERLWKLDAAGQQPFSIHREVLERAKWRYLAEDLGGQSSGVALEVGCGSGTIGATLAGAGYNAILLDYSMSAIDLATRSFHGLPGRERKHYVMGNAFSLPIRDGSVDVVVSGGLLEHFEDPAPVVNEMARVLKPGGLFYADIWPQRFSLLRLIERMHGGAEGWYESRMRREDAVSMVKRCGLDPVRVFTAGVMPPRGMRGTSRFKTLAILERFFVGKLEPLWVLMDGTVLADWLGAYYYVSARKPAIGTGAS